MESGPTATYVTIACVRFIWFEKPLCNMTVWSDRRTDILVYLRGGDGGIYIYIYPFILFRKLKFNHLIPTHETTKCANMSDLIICILGDSVLCAGCSNQIFCSLEKYIYKYRKQKAFWTNNNMYVYLHIHNNRNYCYRQKRINKDKPM